MHAEACRFNVIPGGKQSDDWKDQPSELTFGELVRFQYALCALVSKIVRIRQSGSAWYDDVLQMIERELLAFLRPFPGLLKEDSAPLTDRLLESIPCLLPTRRHWEALASFCGQVADRTEELNRPHLVLRAKRRAQ